jgi:L-fuculose-phosphate aldolase
LENHGIATGGPDLLVAFQRLETLDFCARTLLKAHSQGQVSVLTDKQLAPFDSTHHLLPEFVPGAHSSQERTLRQQIVEIVQRACDRQLMISTEGVVSARVDEHSFLITPTGMDRRSLEIEDVVLICDDQREAGKLPSRSVRLHKAIYERHPEIGCIISAQSPNATAYAISDRRLDTKTIPESYIMLRDIPVIPYGTQYTEPERIAGVISEAVPVILIQNDCVLTIGRNVLQAFDRLEVAEYTARSLIDTVTIGALVPIGDQEIHDLEAAFALPSSVPPAVDL